MYRFTRAFRKATKRIEARHVKEFLKTKINVAYDLYTYIAITYVIYKDKKYIRKLF